jgi:hypothetical protein
MSSTDIANVARCIAGTESMAERREVNSFECIHCRETLESWNSACVPTYRLVVGPLPKHL